MIQEKIETVWRNITYIIGYCYKYCKVRIVSIFVVALMQGIAACSIVLFHKYAILSFEQENGIYILGTVVFVYIIIQLFSLGVTEYFCTIKNPVWDLKIKNEIAKELYQKYTRIDMKDLKDPIFYDKYVRALDEADQRAIAVLDSIQQLFSNLFSGIGLLSVLMMLDPMLIIFSIIPVISSTMINIWINKERYDYEMELTKYKRKIDYVRRIFIFPQYKEEIRTYNYQDILLRKNEKAYTSMSDVILKRMPSVLKKSVLGANLFSLLNYGLPAIYLGWKFAGNVLAIGDFSTLLIGTANLSCSIFYLVIIFPQMIQHAMFIENLREILEYRSDMEPDEDAQIVKRKENHGITLENVCFRYSDAQKDVLKNISMQIKAGEKIALVGENGAGKTTLIKLLLRLYDPQRGKLYIDGAEYTKCNVDSLRQAFATVHQNFQTFAFSIGENILTEEIQSNEEREKVWEALRKSGLDRKVRSFSEGINTAVTNEFEEDGISLSGGENQKLAIARALCKSAGVLIMDEPSSSLDALAEQEMFARMKEICQGKTLIFISHHLYTTQIADRIYYLENGEIEEEGSHEELMKRNGKYAKMYRVQAEQYGG